MRIDFDYDLGETVRIGSNDMTLRKAVEQYIDMTKNASRDRLKLPEWLRDKGKRPSVLTARHMEQLSKLPIFTKS